MRSSVYNEQRRPHARGEAPRPRVFFVFAFEEGLSLLLASSRTPRWALFASIMSFNEIHGLDAHYTSAGRSGAAWNSDSVPQGRSVAAAADSNLESDDNEDSDSESVHSENLAISDDSDDEDNHMN
mmetsp:Transcript_21552/g.41854  ORF Transcript_21552/g.41854 Transcript_21552/m.41854 type:complete len:126 (-) Transcript_21552:120-497(-)